MTSTSVSPRMHALTVQEITVRVVDSVDQVSAADWSAVSDGTSFYSSPRWLGVLETDPTWDTWYFIARGANSEILAIMPAYLPSGDGPPHGESHFYAPAAIFGEAGAQIAGDGPVLLLGGRCGYETRLLLRPELGQDDRRAVLSEIQARAGKLAAAWGAGGTAMMHLVPSDTATAAQVLDRRPLITEVTSEFDLRGTRTLHDLTARLSGHRRRRIVQEMRRFADGELRLRWVRLSDAVEQLAPLAARHQQRYGHPESVQQLRLHLEQQAERLDDLSRVLLCERAGTTVGALLAYEWQNAWYPRIGAAGDGLKGQDAALFNLFYYEPINRAIEAGASRYVAGPSSLQTKILRGADVMPRWSVIAGSDDPVAAAEVGRRWNADQLATWNQELGIQLVEPA